MYIHCITYMYTSTCATVVSWGFHDFVLPLGQGRASVCRSLGPEWLDAAKQRVATNDPNGAQLSLTANPFFTASPLGVFLRWPLFFHVFFLAL